MSVKFYDRRSLRLPNYDYTSDGAYFVTICIEGRRCLLGNVQDGCVYLNHVGKMVQAVWDGLPRYHGVDVDAFIIMPNHVHGIIIIDQKNVGATPCGCPAILH